ncbi:MAG TPA: alkaline phosphatase family protein, partial [Candidatus Methylomirabilis sp.]|nr:alkaline phosphatase family protein [Candidatus Methylomirabilis sp.]
NDGLLIVTWDESDMPPNRILMLFVGPMVQPGRYHQRIDHYNVLRTLEDMYGLTPIGQAASAVPITGIWITPASRRDTERAIAAVEARQEYLHALQKKRAPAFVGR